MPLEVLEEFFVRLVGNEPQRQFPQGDEVVGAEEVSEGLGDVDPAPPITIRAAAIITQTLRRSGGSWRIAERTVAAAGSG